MDRDAQLFAHASGSIRRHGVNRDFESAGTFMSFVDSECVSGSGGDVDRLRRGWGHRDVLAFEGEDEAAVQHIRNTSLANTVIDQVYPSRMTKYSS